MNALQAVFDCNMTKSKGPWVTTLYTTLNGLNCRVPFDRMVVNKPQGQSNTYLFDMLPQKRCNYVSSQMRTRPLLIIWHFVNILYDTSCLFDIIFKQETLLYSLRCQSLHCAAVLKTCEQAGGDYINVKIFS